MLWILHAARLIINNVQHVISLCAKLYIYFFYTGDFKAWVKGNSWFIKGLWIARYSLWSSGYSEKQSKSCATNRKYDIYYNKFKSWCLQFKLSHLLALPSTVSMYLTSLIQTGVSVAVLNSIFYAVKWYHNIFLFEDPCVNRLIG